MRDMSNAVTVMVHPAQWGGSGERPIITLFFCLIGDSF
jgi:hypothetical protein